MPLALSALPVARASPMPFSVRSGLRQPVKRFLRFHSLSPWRTRIRVPVIAERPYCLVWSRCRSAKVPPLFAGSALSVVEAEHVDHGIKARLLAGGPQHGASRAIGIDGAVL